MALMGKSHEGFFMTPRDWIVMGEIYREHGLKGEVKVYIYSGSMDNFKPGLTVRLKKESGDCAEAIIKKVVPYQKWFLTSFSLFHNPEEAKQWRQATLEVKKEDLQQTDNYWFELEGFEVETTDGKKWGTLIGVTENKGQLLYVVSGDKERLIPVVEKWLVLCDKKNKRIVLSLPEGFWDL